MIFCYVIHFGQSLYSLAFSRGYHPVFIISSTCNITTIATSDFVRVNLELLLVFFSFSCHLLLFSPQTVLRQSEGAI